MDVSLSWTMEPAGRRERMRGDKAQPTAGRDLASRVTVPVPLDAGAFRADLLRIRRLTRQRRATKRHGSWRKPDAAVSDHTALAQRAPMRVAVAQRTQIPAHRDAPDLWLGVSPSR